MSDLLGMAATRLAAAGVAVHWPRDLAQDLTATAVVRSAPGSATDGTGFFESEDLLRFGWQIALGGDPLTEAEMDALAEAHRPVVRLRDQWVLVDPALVRKARKRDLGLLDPVDALSVALTGGGGGRRRDGGGGARRGAGRPPRPPHRRRAAARRAPARPRRHPCATTSCGVWPGWTS